jgi:hypothetical protein
LLLLLRWGVRTSPPLLPPIRCPAASLTSLPPTGSTTWLQGDQFGYCPPWALAWPYRKLNLLKELLAYDADILCLQEVQSNHFQVRCWFALFGCLVAEQCASMLQGLGSRNQCTASSRQSGAQAAHPPITHNNTNHDHTLPPPCRTSWPPSWPRRATPPSTRRRPRSCTPATPTPSTAAPPSSGGTASRWSRSMRWVGGGGGGRCWAVQCGSTCCCTAGMIVPPGGLAGRRAGREVRGGW